MSIQELHLRAHDTLSLFPKSGSMYYPQEESDTEDGGSISPRSYTSSSSSSSVAPVANVCGEDEFYSSSLMDNRSHMIPGLHNLDFSNVSACSSTTSSSNTSLVSTPRQPHEYLFELEEQSPLLQTQFPSYPQQGFSNFLVNEVEMNQLVPFQDPAYQWETANFNVCDQNAMQSYPGYMPSAKRVKQEEHVYPPAHHYNIGPSVEYVHNYGRSYHRPESNPAYYYGWQTQQPNAVPYQYPAPVEAQEEDSESAHMGYESPSNEKKRRAPSTSAEKERRVRPKVVPEKGARQCEGLNRKKNIRCRNASLMEFIGPRPRYCAEHIDLDPDCLYTKCQSSFHKVKGDGKSCREVVLKEFEFCHKHYTQATEKMVGTAGYDVAKAQFERVSSLLKSLETEASLAKKQDPDLFQRKHKLIPKFQQMLKCIEKRLVELADSQTTQ